MGLSSPLEIRVDFFVFMVLIERYDKGRSEIAATVPHIGVVDAGGTISSIMVSDGYRIGAERDLMGMLQVRTPSFVAGRFTIGETIVAFRGLSENMTDYDRDTLGLILENMVDNGKYNSIVVTHGTDSMELTLKKLIERKSLIYKIKNKGMPIIFTGAEKDAEDPKTDVWDSLMDSLDTAAEKLPPDIYLQFHKRLIPAEFLVKKPYIGDERFDFMDVRSQEYAEVVFKANERALDIADRLHIHFYGKSLADLVSDDDYQRQIRELTTGVAHPEKVKELSTVELEEFEKMDVMVDPHHKVFEYRVDVAQPNHLDMLALKEIWLFPEVQTVLLTLYHSGTANTIDPLSSVAQLVQGLRKRRGIVFFAVAENGEPIDLHAYDTSVELRKAGVVPLYDMPYYAAQVKLRWAVEQTQDPTEVIELMLKNVVGEIDECRIHREDIGELQELYRQTGDTMQQILSTRTKKQVFWESYYKK